MATNISEDRSAESWDVSRLLSRAMADTKKPSEDYLTTSSGFRFKWRPAGKTSEILIGPVASALAKREQAERSPAPPERPSLPRKPPTKPSS